ncbi:MAG: zinc-ribbon domain-containing protein [Clostridia bacterium]|nr:zinc-ribbon domain-containing protein [Clostridia bacterium]
MKSIKPGRAPSMMGGIVGIFMVIFGIGWTIVASQLHFLMVLFGIVWTGIALMNTIYNFKNATGKNRYSSYDIVDANREPDPMNERYGQGLAPELQEEGNYCPYCGSPAKKDHRYCAKCGKELH